MQCIIAHPANVPMMSPGRLPGFGWSRPATIPSMSSLSDPGLSWLVRVDTGGTFTDGWARSPEGEESCCKVLSSGVLRTRGEKVVGAGCYRLAGDLGAGDGLLQEFSIQGGGVVAGWLRGERLLTVEGGRAFEEGELLELL